MMSECGGADSLRTVLAVADVVGSYKLVEKHILSFMSAWQNYCKSFIPQVISMHQQRLGRRCDLVHPARLSDKLEWLKIYDSTFMKTYCSDKITVKQYVASKLSKDIIVPTLGIYNTPSSIDFSKLPNSYVIKPNHDSHSVCVIYQNNIPHNTIISQLSNSLSRDYSQYAYEMHYQLIPRKILAEAYLGDGVHSLTDYKFLCFNGEPKLCQVISDRHLSSQRLNYYDMNWTPRKDISRVDFPANYNKADDCPSNFDLMVHFARVLSKEFKFVRVDFYNVNDHVFFGELTFIPGAAFIQYTNDYIDFELGDWLRL